MLATTPLITEFMAANQTTLADGDGNYSDWIEIYNPTAQAVALDGWYLTDDLADLDRWPFPDITLQPNDYLIVFASSPENAFGERLDDYVDAGGFLHANFSLDADGEYLGLTMSDGMGGQTIVHEYVQQYPLQTADVSYGIGQSIATQVLIDADAKPATEWAPGDGTLDAPSPGEAPPWTLASFYDSLWRTSAPSGSTGVGFDAGDEEETDDPGPSPDATVLPGGLLGRDLTDPLNSGNLVGTIAVGNTNSPGGEEPWRAPAQSVLPFRLPGLTTNSRSMEAPKSSPLTRSLRRTTLPIGIRIAGP